MESLKELQKRVDDLLDKATPRKELKEWVKGSIPEHYKKLSITFEKVLEYATEGAVLSLSHYDDKLFFTQALVNGAIMSGDYDSIYVITSSQTGKSYGLGQVIPLYAYYRNEKIDVVGNTDVITEKIMGWINTWIAKAPREVTQDLLEPVDKLSKLKQRTSKKGLAWGNRNSEVKSLTLAGTSTDALKSQAIGESGAKIMDEAAFIESQRWADVVGRAQLSNKDKDKQSIVVAVSNPHKDGNFMREMNEVVIDERKLVIWADVRTAVEEGSYESVDFIKKHEYYKEPIACKKYLLCELSDYSEESMFNSLAIDDTEDIDDYNLFMGIDSAYKGRDDIDVALSGIHKKTGMFKLFDIINIDKANWEDGTTSRKILDIIRTNIRRLKINYVCVDIGYGVYITEGLNDGTLPCKVVGINFGNGATSHRCDLNQYAAVYGANKRAEMHLDLQQLIDGRNIVATSNVEEKIRQQMNVTRLIDANDSKMKRVIPKKEIKQALGKSPDELDSVLLSIHAGIMYNMSRPLLLYQKKGG